MDNFGVIAITVVSFILAAVICLSIFGGNTESPLLVPVFIIAWAVIAVAFAVLFNQKKDK